MATPGGAHLSGPPLTSTMAMMMVKEAAETSLPRIPS